MTNFDHIETGGVPIKAWLHGVHTDDNAIRQLQNVALLGLARKMLQAIKHSQRPLLGVAHMNTVVSHRPTT